MTNEKKQRISDIGGILLRIVLILVVGASYYTMGSLVLKEIAEHNLIDLNTVRHVGQCHDLYDEGNYGELITYMNLYKLYSENYDMYWEAVDGFLDYQRYLQWVKADTAGVKDSDRQLAYYRQKVSDNAKQSRFEENKELLAGYAEAVTIEK